MIADLAQAYKTALRRPVSSLYVVLLLGISLALAASMFGLLDAVLLRGLPFPDGDRLVTFTTAESHGLPMPAEDFLSLRAAQRVFPAVGGFRPSFNSVATSADRRSDAFTATYVTANLFSILGVRPILGRGFEPTDELDGAEAVVLISHGVWKSQFAGREDVVGEQITLNREPMTVIGVMPPGFHFPIRQEAWAVIRWRGRPWSRSAVFAVGALPGSLRPLGAEQALQPLVRSLDAASPGETDRSVHVRRYVEAVVPPAMQRALHLLVATGLVVLMAAALNVSGLRYADVLGRSDELATRRALGASGWRLARHLFAESIVLSAAATILGCLLAVGLLELAGRRVLAGGMLAWQFWVDPRFDGRTFFMVLILGLLVALLGGLMPAIATSRQFEATGGGRSTMPAHRSLTAALLVVGQFGASIALVVGAAHLAMSAQRLLHRQLGFDADGLVRSILTTYQAGFETADARRAFWGDLLARLEADPGFEGASLTRSEGSVAVRLASSDDGNELLPRATVLQVVPGYFDLLRLPMQAGRDLLWAELDSPAPDSGAVPAPAVVSRSFAHRRWGGSGLGERFELIAQSRPGSEGRIARVVGVVADQGSGRSDKPYTEDIVYLPRSFEDGGGGVLFVRSAGTAREVETQIERHVRAVNPLVAVLDSRTLAEELAIATWTERRLAQLSSFFAAAVLALSGLGLFALLAANVAGRSKELAIRTVVGARPGQLGGLILARAGLLMTAGLLLGLVLSALELPLLRQFFYDVDVWDPWAVSFGLAGAITVGLLALVAPLRRARRIDPVRLLSAL